MPYLLPELLRVPLIAELPPLPAEGILLPPLPPVEEPLPPVPELCWPEEEEDDELLPLLLDESSCVGAPEAVIRAITWE